MNDALLLTLSLMWLDRLSQRPRSTPPVRAVPARQSGGSTAGTTVARSIEVPPRSMRRGLPPMTALQSLLPGPEAIRGPGSLPLGEPRVSAPTDIVCEAPGSRPVGQVRVTPTGRGSIFIENLRVEEPWRGQGLGRGLLSEAFELGHRWGCSRAWLVADDHGSGRLLRWYRSLGFLPTGRHLRSRPVLEASLRLRVRTAKRLPFTFRAIPAVSPARIHPRERP